MKAFRQPRPPKRLSPIRLSPTNAETIALGLGWIAAVHHAWSAQGVTHFSRPELRLDAGRFDPGAYSSDLMQMLLALADAVIKIRCSGGRLYDLDHFQLAAMIFAVRVAAQEVQHGHAQTAIGNFERRAQRLIARLEKYRKRGKRALFDCRAVTVTKWKNKNGNGSFVGCASIFSIAIASGAGEGT